MGLNCSKSNLISYPRESLFSNVSQAIFRNQFTFYKLCVCSLISIATPPVGKHPKGISNYKKDFSFWRGLFFWYFSFFCGVSSLCCSLKSAQSENQGECETQLISFPLFRNYSYRLCFPQSLKVV